MRPTLGHFRLLVTLLIATALGSFQSAVAAADGSPGSARSVTEKVLGDVLAILRDNSLSKADRTQRVKQIAYDHMDFQTISRLALGRHWKELSDAQQKEFIDQFRQHMSATYGQAIDHYTDEDINVTGDRGEANGDWTVQTRIVGQKSGGGPQEMARVDYRLRQIDNEWKVIDVTVDNVSMIANFRAQFQDIMANGGIDRLMKLLREKNIPQK